MASPMDRKALKKLRKKERKTSQQSTSSTPGGGLRHRRGGLGAFQFKQEKLHKQFMQMVKDGKSSEVRAVLEGGLELEDINNGTPALLIACSHGYMETVAVLLRYGAYVNTCGEADSAPIHAAARKGHCGTIALLLSHGANVNLVNKSDKRTSLHTACLVGNDEVVRLLLDNRAKVDQPDIYGSTPLHLAARMARQSTVELLLTYGSADVNAYDNDGWTSLHLAAESGNINVVKLLLKHHVQTDSRNKYGRTPLHWAACNGHSHIVVELIRVGADPNIKDFHGKKPLQYADVPTIRNLLQPLTNNNLELTQKRMVSSIGLLVKIDPRVERVTEHLEKDAESPLPVSPVDLNEGATTESSGISSPGSNFSLSKQDVKEESHVFSAHFHHEVEDSDTESSPNCSQHAEDRISNDEANVTSTGSNITPTTSYLTKSHKPVSSPKTRTPITSACPSRRESEDKGHITKDRSHITDDKGHDTDDKDHTTNENNHHVPKEALKHKKLLNHTFEKIMQGITTMKSDVQSMSRGVGRSRDSENAQVIASTFQHTQQCLQKMLSALSDLQEELSGDAKLVESSCDNLSRQCQRGFSDREPLPPVFYQAVYYCCGRMVSQQHGGWHRVVRALEHYHGNTDVIIKDIHSRGEDALACSLIAMSYACLRVAMKTETAIRDLLNFMEKCGLGNKIKSTLVQQLIDFVRHNSTASESEHHQLGATLFYSLSTRLDHQGHEMGTRLGVSREQLARLEQEMGDSAQALCLAVLSVWNSSMEVDCSDKRLGQLAECLIDMGREDLLNCIVHT